MKTAFGFLVADRLHHEELWRAYFAGTDAVALFHPYEGYYTGGDVAESQFVVPTKPTTWAKTLKAHLSIYEAFLRTDCTHLVLASESCIPIKPYKQLRQTLDSYPGHSLMNTLRIPAWFQEEPYKSRNHGRRIYKDMVPSICSHEQWCILSREHVQILYDRRTELHRNFCDCYADNESFMGTALRHFGRGHELIPWRTTWTEWPTGGKHPHRFRNVDEDVLMEASPESFFLRKVNQASGVQAVWKALGLVEGAETQWLPPKNHREASGPAELLVTAHVYYDSVWPELSQYIHNVPEKFDLYVNVVEGPKEIHASTEELVERIKAEWPFAVVLVSPNQGRDVGGLFRVLAEIPKDRKYKAWCNIHTKRSPQYKEGYGDKWRGTLLDAILGTREHAAKCLAEVLKPDIGIVGTRKWLGNDQTANTALIDKLCTRMGCKNDKGQYIAGTMFWAKGELLEVWRHSGLKQSDFQTAEAIDGTLAHAWERTVSIQARHLKLQTVGVDNNRRVLREIDPPKPPPAERPATKPKNLAEALGIERSFLVNLKSRPDKLARVGEELAKANLAFQRVEAVDADAMLIASQKPKTVRHKTIGCTLTHQFILRMALELGLESLIVYEDVCVLNPDFQPLSAAFVEQLPDDWTFLWLGWTERHNRHNGLVASNAQVARPDDVMGTHAYAIRGRENIQKVLEASLCAKDHWDIWLNRTVREWPGTYKPRRALFTQDAATSDIHPEQTAKMQPHIQWAISN